MICNIEFERLWADCCVCARRPLLPSHVPAQSPGEWLPSICRLGRSNGSKVIGRIRTGIGREAPTMNRRRQGGFQPEWVFWPTPLDYMLSVVREVNAPLECLNSQNGKSPYRGVKRAVLVSWGPLVIAAQPAGVKKVLANSEPSTHGT